MFNPMDIISPIGSLIGGIHSMNMQQQQYEDMKHMNFMNNLWNYQIMKENWKREDTAIQRRMADLKAAGLNPLMAGGIGGAGAGQLLTMSAPTGLPDIGANFGAQMGNTMDLLTDMSKLGLEREKLGYDSKKTEAETNQIKKATEAIDQNIAESKVNVMQKLGAIKTQDIQREALRAGKELTEAQTKQIHQELTNYALNRLKTQREIDALESKIRVETSQRRKMSLEEDLIAAQTESEKNKHVFYDSMRDFFGDSAGDAIGGLLSTVGISAITGTAGKIFKEGKRIYKQTKRLFKGGKE